jgi:hypothetical protein
VTPNPIHPLEYARPDPRAKRERRRLRIRHVQLIIAIVCMIAGGIGIHTALTAPTADVFDLSSSRGLTQPGYARGPEKSSAPFLLGCCAGIPLAILGLGLFARAFAAPEPPAVWSQLPSNRLLPRMALWRHQIARGRANPNRSSLKAIKVLHVLFDRQCIGQITATAPLPDRFFGYFTPNPDFYRHRLAFDEAWNWSRQFEEALSVESIDDAAWEGYIAAIRKITDRITLPEFPMAIEAIGIDHYLAIEVKLAEPDV